MESKQIYDMIIIGGGPGGYTAAIYAGRGGLSVLVLEQLGPGGQMATTQHIDNYPGFSEGADGFDLAEKMQNQAQQFGAVTKLEPVTELKPEGKVKEAVTPFGRYQGRTVAIATGASPRKLGLAEEDAFVGKGISYCATCDGMFYRGKTVAVIGGGNSAVEEALYLSRLCEKVYLVHRRDSLRADRAGALAVQKQENIEMVWNSVVTGLTGDPETGKLAALTLQDTQTGKTCSLTCQGAFVSIGRVPNTQLVKGLLELDSQGYLAADETTRTSLPGVFAVGDVRKKPLRQIITAAADGAVAAHFAQEYLNETK